MGVQKTKIVTIQAGQSISEVFSLVDKTDAAFALQFDGLTNITQIRVRANATPIPDGSDLPIATWLTNIPYTDGQTIDFVDHLNGIDTPTLVLKVLARSAFQLETLNASDLPTAVTNDLQVKISYWGG
jgi:hypothetical protein